MRMLLCVFLLVSGGVLSGCGDDDVEADRRGIGSECTSSDDCFEDGQSCLTQFKGGYCGTAGCTTNTDCPDGAGCVMHTDGTNYCFRLCVDKPECNSNRAPDNESNCSSSITWLDDDFDSKACVPPSS